MATEEIVFSPLADLSRLLRMKALSAVDLARVFISRVRAVDPGVHAFTHLDEETVLAEAAESDARRADGRLRGPLDGLPVGMKDVIAVRGQPLTCSSRMLEHYRSPYDATVTERLRAAGAIPFGRLNMDEFAMGSSTENSAFGVTANPWNLDYVAGGSSGGSAAAVAAGEVPVSLGSDTGGSIRQPASFCGVVGLKPTYGRVSRYGLVAFASSLDQIGPFGRSLDDVAWVLGAIAGQDRRDSTSCDLPGPDFGTGAAPADRPWKLGVPREYFGPGVHPEVRAAVEQAIRFYGGEGCELVEVSLPLTDLAVPVYYIIATAEASSNLARYDGVRYTRRADQAEDGVDLYFKTRGQFFGDEVKRRIILGTYVLSSGYYDAYYLRAQKVRTLIRRDFMSCFQQVDALITPTSPLPAFRKGEKSLDPLAMYMADVFTLSVNLAGLPALSLPCGKTSQGLPIGLQLIGPPFAEGALVALGRLFEQAHDFRNLHPRLPA